MYDDQDAGSFGVHVGTSITGLGSLFVVIQGFRKVSAPNSRKKVLRFSNYIHSP